ALTRGPELDFDALLRVAVLSLALGLRVGQTEPALPAGEQRARDLCEIPLHGRERLGEAPLDRFGQLTPQLLELCERLLEVRALRAELVEVPFLALVLLLGERIHAAQLLAAPFEPDELAVQLIPWAFRGLG